jgi:SecD/SecF fusion protein
MRSVNTSLVVLLPILSLLLFGGETLKNFAFAMFVGLRSAPTRRSSSRRRCS